MERWHLGAPRLLGREYFAIWRGWDKRAPLHGACAGGAAMGETGGAGEPGWPGGAHAQRDGLHALERGGCLGSRRQGPFGKPVTDARADSGTDPGQWHRPDGTVL